MVLGVLGVLGPFPCLVLDTPTLQCPPCSVPIPLDPPSLSPGVTPRSHPVSPGCPHRVPYQVFGQLGEDGEGGELAALAFGVRREGLQGLAALRVPVSQASIPD